MTTKTADTDLGPDAAAQHISITVQVFGFDQIGNETTRILWVHGADLEVKIIDVIGEIKQQHDDVGDRICICY